jgi:hypothetical protein
VDERPNLSQQKRVNLAQRCSRRRQANVAFSREQSESD